MTRAGVPKPEAPWMPAVRAVRALVAAGMPRDDAVRQVAAEMGLLPNFLRAEVIWEDERRIAK